MLNHEYALAIPIERLLEAAAVYSAPECTSGAGCAQSPRVRSAVATMLCPCIRGDACVCAALSQEFEAQARRAQAGTKEVSKEQAR